MKYIVTIAALSIGLTSCASGTGVNVAPDVTAFENGVIADVEAACQVEPVLADVAALFPIYGTAVGAAANAICAAVAKIPKPANMAMIAAPSGSGKLIRAGFPPVVVHGKIIHFQ
jgi:hypothetical protein